MTVALAECDRCGGRMPLREAFSTGEIMKRLSDGDDFLMVGEGRCTCGGTLREDPRTTLAALEEFLREENNG